MVPGCIVIPQHTSLSESALWSLSFAQTGRRSSFRDTECRFCATKQTPGFCQSLAPSTTLQSKNTTRRDWQYYSQRCLGLKRTLLQKKSGSTLKNLLCLRNFSNIYCQPNVDLPGQNPLLNEANFGDLLRPRLYTSMYCTSCST